MCYVTEYVIYSLVYSSKRNDDNTQVYGFDGDLAVPRTEHRTLFLHRGANFKEKCFSSMGYRAFICSK